MAVTLEVLAFCKAMSCPMWSTLESVWNGCVTCESLSQGRILLQEKDSEEQEDRIRSFLNTRLVREQNSRNAKCLGIERNPVLLSRKLHPLADKDAHIKSLSHTSSAL